VGEQVDQQAQQAQFMSALVTEHFVLQSAASTTVSESSSRASLYMLALSSSLVGMGFVAQSPNAFVPFVATVLPILFVLGMFTTVRLVETTVENLRFMTGISRIRTYYRGLSPEAAAFFAPWEARAGASGDGLDEALASIGSKRGWLAAFFTLGSMVATINSLVGGAGVALLTVKLAGTSRTGLGVLLGLAATVVSMTVFYLYQRRQFRVFESGRLRRTVGGRS
jgi:hypothetical protein